MTAALARCPDEGPHLSTVVDDRRPARDVRVGVRQDVAGPEVLEQERLERERGSVVPEIDHHRHAGLLPCRNRSLHRVPLRAAVVGDFDADDHARMLPDAHRGQPGVHVGQILFDRPALHAGADDVDERQDARASAIDDLLLELEEVAPSGAARIDERRLAAAERVGVGLDRGIGVAEVGVLLGAEEHVGVDVDEAWHHVETCRVDRAPSLGGIDVGADARDLRSNDGDIHDGVDAVCRIDDAAVLDQQVELGGLLPAMNSRPRVRRQHPGDAQHDERAAASK